MFNRDSKIKIDHIKSRLLQRKRIVVLNDDSFEEIFSLRLSTGDIFAALSLVALILVITTTVLIFFTPIRELIPGYTSDKLRREALQMSLHADSLAVELEKHELYLQSLQKVMTNQLDFAHFSRDSILSESDKVKPKLDLAPSQKELDFRKEVESEKAKLARKKTTK